MKFGESSDDFFGHVIIHSKAFNVLKGYTTNLTTPAVLIFADGDLEKLEIKDAKFVSDPSAFLEDNETLAKSVKYILANHCFEFENNPEISGEELNAVNGKYNGFATAILKKP